ncbi:unnamed protein product [Hydatigera taeniaeformis]|uniref:Fibronectin type-III domain-containing protein n=1 Tax=Hydatigena taeniaeformis TaxID=6205 RepID=A0A0R3X4Z8_HYDTA|nr:unnamed protein product [Hydatigera taeniaeformis]
MLVILLISPHTSICAVIEHKGFEVTTDIISPTRVRLSWESESEVEGTKASRFRVLCSSSDRAPIEAIVTTTTVELDTFKPGVEYTCEVHPVWDSLFNGLEVISANPGISQPFVMNFKEQADLTAKSKTEEGKGGSYQGSNADYEQQRAEEGMKEPQTTLEGSGDFTAVKQEDHIPEVNAAPHVRAESTGGQIARVMWNPVEANGTNASRYRIICQTEDPLQQPIKVASTKQTVVEVGAFEPGLEYSCSVYAIWDDLVPGVEVMSIAPGISNAFKIPSIGELCFFTD